MDAFKVWLESNLRDLYQSTVSAFPKTTRRQHSVETIKITKMEWTPFVGMKTLFIKGLAQNVIHGAEYSPQILFKNVKYHNTETNGLLKLVASDNRLYLLEKLSSIGNNVLLRCGCADHQWRFCHYNSLNKSLYGRDRRKYEGQGLWKANPKELPGMCKHLLAMIKSLESSGIIM